mmetsp:Transcript_8959/g.17130  ORF Transcript_8959/g.17130 Transcript_8959/m.17130 type:complete len:92 (-) Transcript_8959:143-418(-)
MRSVVIIACLTAERAARRFSLLEIAGHHAWTFFIYSCNEFLCLLRIGRTLVATAVPTTAAAAGPATRAKTTAAAASSSNSSSTYRLLQHQD